MHMNTSASNVVHFPRAAIKICTNRQQLYPCANTHTHTYISVINGGDRVTMFLFI